MSKRTKELKAQFQRGEFQERLREIYVDEKLLEYQQDRYVKALESFEGIFGEKEVDLYSAPGRSEVGGNHTDHQRGKVIATSLNLDAIAVVAGREDSKVNIKSDGYRMIQVDIRELEKNPKEAGTSRALVKGVMHRLEEKGYALTGFDAYMTSDVLNGAGMSSSAAFEVLIGTICSYLSGRENPDPVFLAQAGQYAENVYFEKPCGLMDQMACSVGGLIHIDFEDKENPKVTSVHVDFEHYGHSLCITDTKASHADLTDEYAAIPQEMKAVAAYFGKEVLREVEPQEFYQKLAKVRAEVGDRAILRAIHLFRENDRVDRQMEALEAGDFDRFLKLIKASGASSFQYLQNVYASGQIRNQEVAVGLAVSEAVLDGRGAFRVHGGGFAGTIQAFVPNEMVETYQQALDAVFGEGSCHVLKVRPYGGIRVV